MRYRLFIFLPFLFFIKFDAEAQAKKIKFHSINSIGFVASESGTDMILQSVNGIMYKNLYSGVGFGADYYNYNSYPLFFDQRIYFAKNKKTFVYGDLGYNLPGKNRAGKEIYYYNSFHFSGGIYTDFGIGYKLKFINKSFFTFSSGFAYKEINNKVGTLNPCLVGPCPVDYNYYKYRNGRVLLKAGVDF